MFKAAVYKNLRLRKEMAGDTDLRMTNLEKVTRTLIVDEIIGQAFRLI